MSSAKFSWVDDIDCIGIPAYLTDSYQQMLAKYDGSEARILSCRSEGKNAYLHLLVRDIGDDQKEAYSAYGYGGLLGEIFLSVNDVELLKRVLAEEGVLAAFIRHSPFLFNQKFWPIKHIELNRLTYSTDLMASNDLDSYTKSIPQKLRWSVNYARRNGVLVVFRPLLECSTALIRNFYLIYKDVMQKKNTSDYYNFSEDFFLEHARLLGNSCELVEIIDKNNGRLLGGAFFLLDDSTGWVHYHLSAATLIGMKMQCMELMMASAICRYGNMGYNFMHMGGGHNLDESDGLSRFKSKFAKKKLDFTITKLICDEERYYDKRKSLDLENSSKFLILDAKNG